MSIRLGGRGLRQHRHETDRVTMNDSIESHNETLFCINCWVCLFPKTKIDLASTPEISIDLMLSTSCCFQYSHGHGNVTRH